MKMCPWYKIEETSKMKELVPSLIYLDFLAPHPGRVEAYIF